LVSAVMALAFMPLSAQLAHDNLFAFGLHTREPPRMKGKLLHVRLSDSLGAAPPLRKGNPQ
jgi:hypothetical protein